MTQEAHIAQLAVKHLTDTLSEQEREELNQWLDVSPEHRQLFDTYTHPDFINQEYKNRAGRKERMEARMAALSANMSSAESSDSSSQPVVHPNRGEMPRPTHRVHFLKTSWFRYAAAVVLVAGGAAIWYETSRSGRNDKAVVTTVSNSEDIQPGTNKALLTIGNNKPIDLASDKTGIAVGKSITYNDGEKIADAGQLLQLATPRGGQYQATLPDGTKIWLNAASSVRFPSKFTGDQRNIEITGEAYMEVAQNSRQPFIVKANGVNIQVLGTSFNVNAYTDEETIKTTLIEGSVKVLTGDKATLLKPGQQASVERFDHSINLTSNTDLEQILAWKNGMFQFKGATIQEVMRQLSRWYDVEVSYEGKMPATRFEGEMQRDLTLASALRILELSNIHLRIEGRKIVITP